MQSTDIQEISGQPVREIIDLAAVAAPSFVDRLKIWESGGRVGGSYYSEIETPAPGTPHLRKLVAGRISKWSAGHRDMIVRLHRDAEELHRRFGIEFPLVSVAHSGGDEHNHGRAVMILRFENGTRIVYKPRGRSLLPLLTQIVDAVERTGGPVFLHFPQTVNRSDYSWSAFIAEETAGADPLAYRALGSLAALAWALGGRDLHGENIVFRREGMYLLDEECFFSPLLPTAEGLPPELQRSLTFYQESAAYTGVLPLVPVVDGIAQEDCSALEALHGRARDGQVLPPHWQSEFLAGFDRLLDAVTDVWPTVEISETLYRHRGASTRIVIRATQSYSDLLDLHFTRTTSREIARQIHERLHRTAAFEPWRAAAQAQESATLMEGDVPLCTAPITGQGLSVDGLLLDIASIDGVQAAQDRCRNPAAWRVAKWEVRAALRDRASDTSSHITTGLTTHSAPQLQLPRGTDSCSFAAQAALSLAQALALLATEHRDGCVVWSDTRISQLRGRQICDAGTSVSSGSAGIMLALSAAELMAGETGDLPQVSRLTQRLWCDWNSRVRARGQLRLGATTVQWLIDDLTVLALAPQLKQPVPAELADELLVRCRQLAATPALFPSAVHRLYPFLASVLSDVSRSTNGKTSAEALGLGRSLLGTERTTRPTIPPTEQPESLVTARAAMALGISGWRSPQVTAIGDHLRIGTAGTDFVLAAVSAELHPETATAQPPSFDTEDCREWGLRRGLAGQMALNTLFPGSHGLPAQYRALLSYLATCEVEELALRLPAPGLSAGAAALTFELARRAAPQKVPKLLPVTAAALLVGNEL
ncbi:DUF4135 domain-containing protein [Streptomyces sp. NPDC006285]|uniref:DUF4135 domain-containing protein n=1 Tax=Streptomyces sp. NPDC006285 TaxID=3364742 RepID=UPI0036C8A468